MKLNYYGDTDSLYIDLNSRPSAETREIVEGLLVDLDKDGRVVGIDIDHASTMRDLKKLELLHLPVVEINAA
ncbi:MAG: DUF2283 domain-containing protein [Elusimicrobia bacterium]|nr:DUF2283 domain-containing protein [Elusimicrobiota bacterium]